jgi:hypothetical protein
MYVKSIKENYFIKQTDNNIFFHNFDAEKIIQIFLPKLAPCKKYVFFIACPLAMEVHTNDPVSPFWGNSQSKILIPGIPGTRVVVTSVLSRWLAEYQNQFEE